MPAQSLALFTSTHQVLARSGDVQSACDFVMKWRSLNPSTPPPVTMVNSALHCAARHPEHHVIGRKLLNMFISEWGGSPTEATAMAELRFASGAGSSSSSRSSSSSSRSSSSSSSVEACWDSLPAELQLSPAVASMFAKKKT